MTALDVRRLEYALKAMEADIARSLGRREGLEVVRVSENADDVQLTLERESTALSLQRESTRLAAVRLALERIADHTYGICERCDDEISTKRLAAVPWTSYCIRCQEKLDTGEPRHLDQYRALAS